MDIIMKINIILTLSIVSLQEVVVAAVVAEETAAVVTTMEIKAVVMEISNKIIIIIIKGSALTRIPVAPEVREIKMVRICTLPDRHAGAKSAITLIVVPNSDVVGDANTRTRRVLEQMAPLDLRLKHSFQ